MLTQYPWTPWSLLCLLSACTGLTLLTLSAVFAEVPADQVPRTEVSRVQGVREGEQTHRQQAALALTPARWASRAPSLPGRALWCRVQAAGRRDWEKTQT